ncbi:F420-dependent oxidoreductase [Aeromicrobium sp. A1-2]|uniref:Pr6Pr family membrane protein n=1 Tax=Aeromicrobium sp. A1-2 TaxID=2107713 RepID=UPI000E4C93C2|nr:Pr6Pr family membrane protein [Aeromicrobium sp. A1-2]AXT86333.1 F420-dependent oxidoreductase [Aeromicrobium sp. A1-2]
MTRLWHALTALLAASALIGQVVLTADRGNSLVNLFSYFTIESNLLVLVTSVLLVQRPDRGGTAFGILRLGSLVAITVTGIVYATLLAGNASFSGAEWWYDKAFHYFVPIMVVVGFLALRPRTLLDRSAYWFMAFPLTWLTYTLIRAEVAEPTFAVTTTSTAPVPYEFLDVAEHGAVSVAVVCVVLVAIFAAIAAGYLAVSRRGASA